VLFAAECWSQVQDVVGGFFADVDDESTARLAATALQHR
jgi:hypothetical protein